LPHSDEAERAILGAVLLNNRHAPTAFAMLDARDFYAVRHATIFEALRKLHAAGSALDLVTLRDALDQAHALARVGGVGALPELIDGTARSANVEHYARIVKAKATLRDRIAAAERYQRVAMNGATPEEQMQAWSDLMRHDATAGAWTPANLEGVTDPNVGRVECLVDRLIPKGENVGIAATFKSGKSLAVYSLLLSALRGSHVFGVFDVPRPLRIVVFQEEMPSREDDRRLRRLALGMGLDPADLLAFVTSGQLVFYNRVGLDLSAADGIGRFHSAVRAASADLVILDSLIAAAGAVDLNDNGAVRRMFSAAFLPLTTEGRSVVYLHHKRKAMGGQRGKDADRDSFLGAQAIAAASGRMYSLERLDDPDDAPDDPTRFRCALTLFGSWTPEEAVSTVLETRDDGDGTTVTALDEQAQVRTGGIDGKQRAGLALAKLVNVRRSIRRKAALAEIAEDLGISARTAADGLAFARSRGWIATEMVEGSTSNEQNLIPGDRWEDAR
jgi:hypothetical protein